MNTAETLGLKVRTMRSKRKASQATVAERAGISRQNLSLIENGRVEVRWSTFLQIADALDFEVFVTIRDIQ